MILKDMRVFLVDEERRTGGLTTTQGGVSADLSHLTSQVAGLTKQVGSLQTQLTTLMEAITVGPMSETETEIRPEQQAQVQQVDLPPFNK